MSQEKNSAQRTIDTIRWETKWQHSAEEKIQIVLEGLRGKDTIAELCRREGAHAPDVLADQLLLLMDGAFMAVRTHSINGPAAYVAEAAEVLIAGQIFE
jgi:transposase